MNIHLKKLLTWGRNALRNRPETAENYEFHPGYLEITERPPAPWAKRMALGLAMTFLLGLLWAIFGQLDIQAEATGQLLITSHSKVIQPLEIAEVTAIHVHDGQRVKTGQTLVSLNLISADAELKDLKTRLHFDQLENARLVAQLSDLPMEHFVPPEDASPEEIDLTKQHLESVWKEMQARINSLDGELKVNLANQQSCRTDIESLKKLNSNIQVRLQARRVLLASHVVSKVELLEHEKEWLDTERSLAQKQSELSVLLAEYKKTEEQKDDYLTQHRREDYDQLIKTQNEAQQLQQQIIKASDHARQQTLRSPVDGVVQQLAVHTHGGVVQPAQQLMVVVPDKDPQEAEVMLLNKDVGFVRAGQDVEIKIDAFPYTHYGTLHGVVSSVSRDAVKDDKLGLVFPAQIRLKSSSMNIDGKNTQLQAGMSVTANIHTGERRVIDYLLSPLQQYQSEALRER